MKKLLLQFAFSAFSLTAFAQLPGFEWATTLENSGENNYTFALATDPAGNVYQTGTFRDTADFDPGAGENKHVSKGYGDCFVSKVDPDGNVLWVKTYGGTNPEYANTIILDSDGNIYISGTIDSSPFDFDPGVDSFMVTIQQPSGYVLKLDPNGEFIHVFVLKYIQPPQPLTPTAESYCTTIHIDGFSNLYIAGMFRGNIDLDPGDAELLLQSSSLNTYDWAGFIVKINPQGNFVRASLIKAHVTSFAPVATIMGIRSDIAGNITVAGDFRGTMDFNPGNGVASLSSFLSTTGSDSQEDIFLLKLDSAGNFNYVKQIGGQGYDYLRSFERDNAGNLIISGYFDGIADFDPSPSETLVSSEFTTVNSSYFAKYDLNGSLVWAKNIGYGKSFAATVDANDNIYVSGTFSNELDMDFTSGEYIITETGSAGMYVAKYDGNAGIIWAEAFSGSANYNLIWTLKTDLSGNLYAGGYFGFTADFDPGENEFPLTANSEEQSFLVKLGPAPLAVKENIKTTRLSLFPNPVGDYCRLQLSDYKGTPMKLEVYNSIGALIGAETVNAWEYTLNTAHFATGVYFVKITSEDKSTVVSRLIK